MRTEEASQHVGWIHLPRKRWFVLAAGLYAAYYFGLRNKRTSDTGDSAGLPGSDLVSVPATEPQGVTPASLLVALGSDAEETSPLEPAEDATDQLHTAYTDGSNITSEEYPADEPDQAHEPAIVSSETGTGSVDVPDSALSKSLDEQPENASVAAAIAVEPVVEASSSVLTHLDPEEFPAGEPSAEGADDDAAILGEGETLRSMPDWLLPEYEDDVPATHNAGEADPKPESNLIPLPLAERIEAHDRAVASQRANIVPAEDEATPAEPEAEDTIPTAVIDEAPEDVAEGETGNDSATADEATGEPQASNTAKIRLAEHQDQPITEPKYIRLRRRRYNRTGT
jgi:hypothetical protein